jgi:eukaryotic-like serine/threonine-protein kinase
MDLTRLGDGPVATVYSGHRDGVPVALKVFPKRFDKRTLAAFNREQSALAKLRVSTILLVDGVEHRESGEPALRMELCARSLAEQVERSGPLAAADVVVLGYAVAGALAAAHGAGVTHGGMSPHNVLFRATGEPVVADFGVVLRQALVRDPLHAIEYLPPETLRTGELNESTDLYGLGAVLHFALTARSPHPGRLGEQPGERVLRILREPVPAINAPDVPVGLSTLVARLLAPAAGNRPGSASLVADQLGTMLPNPQPAKQREDWDDFASPTPVVPSPPPVAVAAPVLPPTSDRPDFDDFDFAPAPAAAAPTVVFTPTPPTRPRRLIRYDLVAGGALVIALLALVPLLLLRDEREEMPTAAQVPEASGARGGDVRVELDVPTDLTDKVKLTWRSTAELDFAVVVAAEGEAAKVHLAQRNRSMTVDVEPGRKYCFMVQATNGDKVYESIPMPLRGATCRK